MEVLQGFDWARHSLSVLLIEVYPRFREVYGNFLSGRGLVQLRDFGSPTGLNEVWYNATAISPAAAAQRTGTGKRNSKMHRFGRHT